MVYIPVTDETGFLVHAYRNNLNNLYTRIVITFTFIVQDDEFLFHSYNSNTNFIVTRTALGIGSIG